MEAFAKKLDEDLDCRVYYIDQFIPPDSEEMAEQLYFEENSLVFLKYFGGNPLCRSRSLVTLGTNRDSLGLSVRNRFNSYTHLALEVSTRVQILILNSLRSFEERSPLLAQIEDAQVILGTEVKLLSDFFSRFFNFFDEKFPNKDVHKLPSFYSELGLGSLLPFSRGNKVRTVEKEFRKLVLGGDWSRAKLRFLTRRLLHFSEVWLMGPLGLVFALVDLAQNEGESKS